jgi:YCII-related domain
MRYLCLIYDDETRLAARSKKEADAFTGEYVAFTEAIRKSGHYLGGEALESIQTATTVRVRHGKVSTTDGPFAETKEQFGRVLPHRRPGPERGHPGGRAHPVGASGEHRGPPDPGVRPSVAQAVACREGSPEGRAL